MPNCNINTREMDGDVFYQVVRDKTPTLPAKISNPKSDIEDAEKLARKWAMKYKTRQYRVVENKVGMEYTPESLEVTTYT